MAMDEKRLEDLDRLARSDGFSPATAKEVLEEVCRLREEFLKLSDSSVARFNALEGARRAERARCAAEALHCLSRLAPSGVTGERVPERVAAIISAAIRALPDDHESTSLKP